MVKLLMPKPFFAFLGAMSFVLFFSISSSAGTTTFENLGSTLEALNPLPILDSQANIFSDKEGKFVGIIGDSTDWLQGSTSPLQRDDYSAIREMIKGETGLLFQSEEPLSFTQEKKTKVARARILLRSDSSTIVVNEEHRISTDGKAQLFSQAQVIERSNRA